jgi:hypothetical protein
VEAVRCARRLSSCARVDLRCKSMLARIVTDLNAHWEHISLIYLKYMSDCLIWPYQALIRLIF